MGFPFLLLLILHAVDLAFLLVREELSLCNKLWFSNPYIFSTQCCRPLIFQTMNYVRLSNPSLKYQRFTPTGCRDIGIRKFDFVAKNSVPLKTNLNRVKSSPYLFLGI